MLRQYITHNKHQKSKGEKAIVILSPHFLSFWNSKLLKDGYKVREISTKRTN